MRPTLFLSDAHLSVERPAQIAMFRDVLARAAALGAEVYILGDLVEFWLGDDDDAPTMRTVVAALAEYSAAGGALKVSLGNRDFLFGERFCAETGATLLPDYLTVQLYGQSVLLTHGDLLCTRDLKYQAFRGYVRDPQNQQNFWVHRWRSTAKSRPKCARARRPRCWKKMTTSWMSMKTKCSK